MSIPYVLTVAETAQVLRVSVKTVHRIIHDGDLPIVWVRGSIRISSLAISDYIATGGVQYHDRYR